MVVSTLQRLLSSRHDSCLLIVLSSHAHLHVYPLFAGPSLIDLWMQSSGHSRKIAVSSFLNLWIVSGALLCSACLSIVRDEDRMKQSLKKIALSAVSDLNGRDRDRDREADREVMRNSLGVLESG